MGCASGKTAVKQPHVSEKGNAPSTAVQTLSAAPVTAVGGAVIVNTASDEYDDKHGNNIIK